MLRPLPLVAILLALQLLAAPCRAPGAEAAPQQPLYRIPLRVHLQHSGRPAKDFLPIFEEINEIWFQASICFEIEAVGHDRPHAGGLDMWFAPDIGAYNGYYDGRSIQMSDSPLLAPAPNPARQPAARTAAHELGHALGLGHRQESDDNLMRSKTYGWQLSQEEILLAREKAGELALEGGTLSGCGLPRFGEGML